MFSKNSVLLFFILFGLNQFNGLKAQSLAHPTIWITQEERDDVLELISKYDWAKSMFDQLHTAVDEKLRIHQSDPNAILDSIPTIPANDSKTEFESSEDAYAHNKVLRSAAYSGMLYFLTQEEKYAQFSADILAFYIDVLSDRTPETTTICGNYFYDPRVAYDQFGLAYDFIYAYLNKSDTEVYHRNSNTRQPFDPDKAQKAIANMVGNALKEYGDDDIHGRLISNHPILTASGALYLILCVEDDVERERLFNVFWETGTKRQNSFTQTILPMFGEQGIWPESTSYSFMSKIPMLLNIVDRIKPELDITRENIHILNGSFLFSNLRYPDRKFARYGDSKRNSDGTENNYRYTIKIAERRGYDDLKQRTQVALKQYYDAQGGYAPKLSDSPFDNSSALHLFWGITLPDDEVGKINYKPTVIVKHAGVALQRNYVEKNNELFGLCGIIGGAHYVHSHCTGIAMELYGAEYVMGPNAGLPKTVKERRIPLHEDYFRLYAGNNTVIVNGTSHGIQPGSWKPKAYVWQNTTVNIASEPKHLEDPISKNFSFATQFLKDEVNHCDQERTLSTIRTSEETAYYFDLFRSKSLVENKFHDYIYHNIGDETTVSNSSSNVLNLTKTNRYNNDIGDPVHSPGWRYFENAQVTETTKDGVQIGFHIKYDNRFMHMFVPEGVE